MPVWARVALIWGSRIAAVAMGLGKAAGEERKENQEAKRKRGQETGRYITLGRMQDLADVDESCFCFLSE